MSIKEYKAQNFGLMPFLVPYVISGRKWVTSRPATPYRQGLKIGGHMNFFTGLRTPNCHRIGTGIVKDKVYWWTKQLPKPDSALKDMWKPPVTEKWEQFAYIEGFDSYEDLYNYFTKHPRMEVIRQYGLICFVFKFNLFEDRDAKKNDL